MTAIGVLIVAVSFLLLYQGFI